jgi:hypothetical protein
MKPVRMCPIHMTDGIKRRFTYSISVMTTEVEIVMVGCAMIKERESNQTIIDYCAFGHKIQSFQCILGLVKLIFSYKTRQF